MYMASSKVDASRFRREGYQIFENIVPKAVIERVRDFLATEIATTMGPAKREIGCDSDSDFVAVIGEIAAGRRGGVETLTKSTRDALSGHFSLETRLSPKLWEIPYSTKFLAIVSALLESGTVFLHMPPTARYVLPGNIHAGVPPHQDISYNRHMTDFVTIWVPLVNIDDDCGGVMMYRGSGHAPEHPVSQSKSEFWQKGVPTDGYTPVHCKIRAGDVLALNKWVVHGSMPNKSPCTRISIDFRFFGERDRSSKHYLDIQKRKVIAPA